MHVGRELPNGLSDEEVRAASRAGLTRVTFGLESGSQRILDAMDKGTSIETNQEFLRHSSEAGISVRCTVIQGYPGEEAADLDLTARFLEQNTAWLDRVRINRFNALVGSRLSKEYEKDSTNHPGLRDLEWEFR